LEQSENDSEENEASESEQFEEIMIDFEARSPNKKDLDTVRNLLQQKLAPFSESLSFAINDLASEIVEQTNIGNVIYQGTSQDDEEEEPAPFPTAAPTASATTETDADTIFGVLSLIDMKSTKFDKISKGLIEFLLKECEKASDKSNDIKTLKENLAEIFKSKHIHYIINERFINVPVDISVPMYESLMADISNIIVPTASNKESANSNVDYWLFLAKIYSEATRKNNHKTIEMIYANPEEEIFEQFSEFKFEIPYGNKASKSTAGNWSKGDATLEATLKVLLVPKLKINDALKKIKSLIIK